MKKELLICLFIGLTSVTQSADVKATTETHKPDKQPWHFNGPFGTYDRAELRRGLQVHREVCAVCHSMKHLRYEKLKALGFTEKDIKSIAAAYEVPRGHDDEGKIIMEKALPKDFFANPYPSENAARAANNGALPVDLSLVIKARHHGPDYVYALLTGYTDPPKGFHLSDGMHYNQAFPGHQIAMPAPLSPDQISYPDGTKATVKQMAHDVSAFLAWASEPEMEERKHMGVMVILFLLLFIGLMYVLMCRTWKDVKELKD